ncbi:MAG: signal peptidase I [Bacilli bacterium]
MKNIINRILKIISSAIFVILVLLIILIIFYIVRVNFLASNDKLGDVKINFYTILTQSMYPTIKAGDVVITYKDDNNKYNAGDVITFISDQNGGITVTHRINEVFDVNNSYSYKTKGDNNNAPDNEIISGDNVLGKVVMKIPKAGYIQQFLVSKTGWIVAVILPCLGIVIYDILKVILIALGIKSVSKPKDDERTKKARKKLKEVVDDEEEE